MTASTMPAVLDALFAIAQRVAGELATDGDAGGAGAVGAFDGPTSSRIPPTYLVIGYRDGGANPGSPVQSSSGIADMGTVQDRESYAVVCHASAYVGSPGVGMKVVRDRAFEVVDAFAAAIALDPQLGGACMRARLDVVDYSPAITTKGPTVVVPFHVQIEAMRKAAP